MTQSMSNSPPQKLQPAPLTWARSALDFHNVDPMPRPIIDTAALRANLLAAMDSEPDSETVFKQEGKRKAEEALNGDSPKRTKCDDGEQDGKGKTENDLEPALNDTPRHTASPSRTAETPGWSGGDLTLAIYGDGQDEDNADDSPHYEKTNPATKHEVETDDERRMESDALLVEAYRDMSAAAEDMALGARKTAEALVAKIAASKREVEATAETLRAQERYELAMARIGRAVAHRGAVRVEVSDGEGSG